MLDKPFHIKRLQHEINLRKESNPRYSLRAFARYLGIGPSTLSRILLNQQEVSQTTCKEILRKLKFNHEDKMMFISSVAEEKKRRAYEELFDAINDEDEIKAFDSYEWLFANSPDLMFVLDRQGRCIHANEPVSLFFHIPEELVIGKTIEEIGIHQDLCETIRQCLNSVFENPRAEKVEECYEDKGSSRCFEITIIPIGHTKDLKAVACHWKDITEKTAIEKVWNHSLQIGEILDSTPTFAQALEKIADHLTNQFCDACIVEYLETGKKILRGNSSLAEEFLKRLPDTSNLFLKERSLEVTLRDSTIIAKVTFLRNEKREVFSLKEHELIRDLQTRSHPYLQ